MTSTKINSMENEKIEGPELALQVQRTNKDMGEMLSSKAIKDLNTERMKYHVLTNKQMVKTSIIPREAGTS